MPDEERAVYLNDQWNTRQVRDVTKDLVFSSSEVFERLRSSLQIYPEMDGSTATRVVRRGFTMAYVPQMLRDRWERSESFAMRFFVSLPALNSPGRIDKKIERSMYRIDAFASGEDAQKYFEKTWERLMRLFKAAPEPGNKNPTLLLTSAYAESRVLRYATHGRFLARPGTFVEVED